MASVRHLDCGGGVCCCGSSGAAAVFSIVAAGGCCDSRGCAFWTDLSLAHNRSGWQGVCESRDRLLAAKVPNENTHTRCNTIDIVFNSLTPHRTYGFTLLISKYSFENLRMGCTVRTDQPHPSSSLNQKRNPRISTVRHRTQHYGRAHDSRTSESSLVVDDLSHLATIRRSKPQS